jgi:hypothetical protein
MGRKPWRHLHSKVETHSKTFRLLFVVVAVQYIQIIFAYKWLHSMRYMRETHALHRTNVAFAYS